MASSSNTAPSTSRALRQRKFPHRRHTTRQRPSPPTLTKRQSTLTQNPWLDTPSNEGGVIDISSDEDYGDGDFEEPRPKKKRKTTKKKAGDSRRQSTLTQLYPLPSKLQIYEDDDEIEDLDNGMQGSDDEYMVPQDQGQVERGSNHSQEALEGQDGYESKERRLTGQSGLQQIPESTTVQDFATRAPRTPKRIRKIEIPSSETPPSIHLSYHRSERSTRSIRINLSQRSPLKQRSTNIPMSKSPLKPSKVSAVSFKQPEVHFTPRKVPLNDTQNDTQALTKSQQALTRSQQVLTNSQQALTNSQKPHSNNASPRLGSQPQPRRRLKRVNTVQDSQFEDLDLDLQTYRSLTGSEHDGQPSNETQMIADSNAEEEDEDGEEYDHIEDPYTYDPANDALDRDAARYLYTQTQRYTATTQSKDVHSEHEEEDEDEDDLDLYGATRPLRRSQEFGSDTINPNTTEPTSVPMPAPTMKPPTLQPRTTIPDSQFSTPSPPSSPPVIQLRSSQVSTVVPTQASPPQDVEEGSSPARYSQHIPPDDDNEFDEPPIAAPDFNNQATAEHDRVSALNIQNSDTRLEDNSSSSPFPLPPWSSPERRRWLEANASNGTTQTQMRMAGRFGELESLVDFSLPPPPPLITSSSPVHEDGA